MDDNQIEALKTLKDSFSAAQPSAQGNFQQPDNFDPDQDIPF